MGDAEACHKARRTIRARHVAAEPCVDGADARTHSSASKRYESLPTISEMPCAGVILPKRSGMITGRFGGSLAQDMRQHGEGVSQAEAGGAVGGRCQLVRRSPGAPASRGEVSSAASSGGLQGRAAACEHRVL
jgi:hypothetical protein